MKEIKKKNFSCLFRLIALDPNAKEGMPAIVLELPNNVTGEDAIVIFQEKGARELAAALLRESDKYNEFIISNKKEGNFI